MMTAQRIERTDIHRPSVIEPDDYQWVGIEMVKVEGLGDALFLQQAREVIRQHMAQTGGTYSHHEHGGNCMICGAWAVYTHLFYHAKTNTYIRTGEDCADKLGMSHGDSNQFRKLAREARKNVAGKKKAQALLADRGLSRCWEIWNSPIPQPELPPGTRYSTEDDRVGSYIGDVIRADGTALDEEQDRQVREMYWKHHAEQKPFNTIRDIVGKLIKYGSASDKQYDFLGRLLKQIDERPAIEAAREAEKANAADCPKGRIEIEGVILSIKQQESDWGTTTKCLVKHDTGYKVWGTLPSFYSKDEQGRVIYESVEVGTRVSFRATVDPSKRDPKFGTYKRPSSGEIVKTSGEVSNAT